jgi:SNF2 family DNA or RNA helicase
MYAGRRSSVSCRLTNFTKQQADDADRELGRARSIELSKITRTFILRRTSKVNEKYLPAKTGLLKCTWRVDSITTAIVGAELTVLCKLTKEQVVMYEQLAAARLKRKRAGSTGAGSAKDAVALACIVLLKKLCAHPTLVADEVKKRAAELGADDDPSDLIALPKGLDTRRIQIEFSSKLQVLAVRCRI